MNCLIIYYVPILITHSSNFDHWTQCDTIELPELVLSLNKSSSRLSQTDFTFNTFGHGNVESRVHLRYIRFSTTRWRRCVVVACKKLRTWPAVAAAAHGSLTARTLASATRTGTVRANTKSKMDIPEGGGWHGARSLLEWAGRAERRAQGARPARVAPAPRRAPPAPRLHRSAEPWLARPGYSIKGCSVHVRQPRDSSLTTTVAFEGSSLTPLYHRFPLYLFDPGDSVPLRCKFKITSFLYHDGCDYIQCIIKELPCHIIQQARWSALILVICVLHVQKVYLEDLTRYERGVLID